MSTVRLASVFSDRCRGSYIVMRSGSANLEPGKGGHWRIFKLRVIQLHLLCRIACISSYLRHTKYKEHHHLMNHQEGGGTGRGENAVVTWQRNASLSLQIFYFRLIERVVF